MRIISLCLCIVLTLLPLSGCLSKKENSSSSSGDVPTPSETPIKIEIYQFKPEIKDNLQKAVNQYMATRPEVVITLETIGGGDSYERALEIKMDTENPPEIFNIGGMTDAMKWKSSLENLAEETWVKDHSYDVLTAVKDGGIIYGMPYNIEGYGFVCNKEIFEKADIDIEAVKTFDELSNAVEKLSQKIKKGEMKEQYPNLEAVFELPVGETWVTGMHTVNIAIAKELETQQKVYESSSISLKHSDALKELFDLQAKYTSNTNSMEKLSSVDYKTQVVGGIAVERVAVIQQGNWIYADVEAIDEKVAGKLTMIPIPLKSDTEEAKLAVGVPMYWGVNKKSSEEEKQAAKEFLSWLYQSTEGKAFIVDEFGFMPPFTSFNTMEPTDPLTRRVRKYIDEKKTLPFVFGSFPDYWGREIFGEEIKKYLAEEVTWEELLIKVKNKWKEMR